MKAEEAPKAKGRGKWSLFNAELLYAPYPAR